MSIQQYILYFNILPCPFNLKSEKIVLEVEKKNNDTHKITEVPVE